ncbi:MAG: Pr6Pr family membrane protein [Actinomycetes bacterium]
MRDTVARISFGIVALIALGGTTLSATLWTMTSPTDVVAFGGGHGDPANFDNWFWRLTITFFYFTILSNIIVGVTYLMLAIRTERQSTAFRTFRLFGLIAIIITGLVVNLYLNRLYTPTGINLVKNDLVHVLSPILATLTWLIFGPRTPFRFKYIVGAIGIGVAWLAVTFIHGSFIHWFPYPFLDVDAIGLTKSLINSVAIMVIAFLLGMAILGLDKVLPGHAALDEAKPTGQS